MYRTNNLQVNLLVNNVLSVNEQEKGHNIEVAIQPKVAFLTNRYRKVFYKYYGIHDEYQRTPHNHRKFLTVYCAPRFQNIMAIHILSAFSSDLDPKYFTLGTQQRFAPAPGACIAYQTHRVFSEYPVDSIRI